MASGTGFGSSEYTQEAEALFAEYLARPGAGEAAFDALCAEHPEYDEELQGLRSDWENVAGLLAAIEALEPPEPRAAFDPEPEDGAFEDAELGGRAPSRPFGWIFTAAALAGLAVGAGAWAGMTKRSNEVLAADNARLGASIDVARGELARGETERNSLARERDELGSRLRAAERARAAAEDRAEALAELRSATILREEAALLWPLTPGRAPAMEAWLARADALTARLADPREAGAELDASRRAALEELAAPDSGLAARIRLRLARARGTDDDLAEAVQAAWDALSSEMAAANEPPLEPSAQLLPLGRDPATGLRRFVFLPSWDGPAEPAPADEDPAALRFLLVPGATAGGAAQERFFLSNGPLREGNWGRALGSPAGAGADRERALAPLGLRAPTEAEWQRAIEVGAVPALAEAAHAAEPAAVEASWSATDPRRASWVVLPATR